MSVHKKVPFQIVYGDIGLRSSFTRISNTLIRHLSDLNATCQEFWLLSFLLSRKWDASHPHPSLAAIAKAANVNRTTAMRWIEKLEKKGLLKVERSKNELNYYDLMPLFLKMKAIEGAVKPEERFDPHEEEVSAKDAPAGLLDLIHETAPDLEESEDEVAPRVENLFAVPEEDPYTHLDVTDRQVAHLCSRRIKNLWGKEFTDIECWRMMQACSGALGIPEDPGARNQLVRRVTDYLESTGAYRANAVDILVHMEAAAKEMGW